MKSRVYAHKFQKIGHSGIVSFAYIGKEELHKYMKQTRPHLQISPLGLVNKYGSKNPKQVKNKCVTILPSDLHTLKRVARRFDLDKCWI